ncbi:MAG TPA: NUDIX domain-containing protein [Streptosporangiaceae bacterium]|nr:NUDIX domain-containing protein [Streptosporangiaceae bacterium]
MGKVEEHESPAEAAVDGECEEETGWRPGPLRHLIVVQPTPGISNSEHHIYRADEAAHIGRPVDGFESERITWVPLAELRSPLTRERFRAAPRSPHCSMPSAKVVGWVGAGKKGGPRRAGRLGLAD